MNECKICHEVQELRYQLDAVGDGDTWKAAAKRLEAELDEARRILSLAVGRDPQTMAYVINEREMQIKQLYTDNATLRGLLREAVDAADYRDSDDEWWGNMIDDSWFERVVVALEGKP